MKRILIVCIIALSAAFIVTGCSHAESAAKDCCQSSEATPDCCQDTTQDLPDCCAGE